jgi:PAS domain S-box-containing protein
VRQEVDGEGYVDPTKRMLADQIEAAMKERRLEKAEMVRRMGTSRAALDRLLYSKLPSYDVERAAQSCARAWPRTSPGTGVIERSSRGISVRFSSGRKGYPMKTDLAVSDPAERIPGVDGLISLLSEIVKSSDDAIVSKTLDAIITSWNPAAERMFGYTAKEAIGQSIRLIIPADCQAEEDYVSDRILHGQKVDHFETVRQTKDGRLLTISLTVSPIRDSHGTVVGASEIARDSTERHYLESLLSSVVASSDDAIVSKTLEGIITSWNPAAQKMFGYTPAEAVGQSIRLIIPADRQAEEDYVLARIRRGEKVDHFETVRQAKDGRLLNISLTVSPVRDGNGLIVGASKIARDITDRKRIETERETALQQLAAALAARDDFIAVAAHELRNPLNILSLMWWIFDRSPGAPDRDVVKKSRAQLARLTALVDRLLDITRIRAGAFDLYRERVNLSRLIPEVVGRFAAEDAAPPISIELEAPIEGTWDPVRIDQVLTNLISNAVKYGMGRPIVVRASLDGAYAAISVQDQGVGIAPELLDRIFERFERADVRSYKDGLGIGLWITKQIVRTHGGTISVQSEPGKGSIFLVRLPLS